MKRFYADVFNAWMLILTVKLIQQLYAIGGDEDETLEDDGSVAQDAEESEDAGLSEDGDSQSLVDPARTRVDPART